MATVFLSQSAYPELFSILSADHRVITIPQTTSLYTGIQDHSDLHIHSLKHHLFISMEIAPLIATQLDDLHIPYTVITESLGTKYPETVLLNAITTDNYLIHSKASSLDLLNAAKMLGLTVLNLAQGYTRCSALPLKEDLLVTSDNGIYKSLSPIADLEILLIANGPVELEGQANGFFAGTAGVVDHCLYINGDISTHPDQALIQDLCLKHSLKLFDVPGKALRDIGSILTL